VLRVCQQALAGGLVVARNGYRVAASDIATAIELLGATMRGTAISIDGNLSSIRDESYTARVKAEREALAADSARDAAQALDAVSESPRSRP
jgi:formiminotetrahydrofolate cyclodeaminase